MYSTTTAASILHCCLLSSLCNGYIIHALSYGLWWEISGANCIGIRTARETGDQINENRVLIRSAKQGRKMNIVRIIGLDRTTHSFALTWKCVHSKVTFSLENA